MPVSVSVCGLPAQRSLTVRVPVRVPAAVGRNVTEMVQVPLGASVAGQLLV